MKNDLKGMILVFLGALCWSTNSVLIKSVPLSPFMIAAMRAVIAGLVFLPFIRPKKINWKNPKLYFSLVIYTIQSTLIVVAVKHTSAAIAVGMQFTAPVWIYLVQRLRGYRFYWRRAVPLYILTVGVIISMFSKADDVTMLGNILALITGVTFALVTVFTKDLGNENPLGIVSVNNLFMAAAVIPIFCLGDFGELWTLSTNSWLMLFALGIGQFGMGYALYSIGLKYTSSARAAMISPMEMVLSPVWVALFIGSLPDVIGLVGFLTIIAGIALEVVFSLRYERAASATPTAPLAKPD